MKDDKVGRIQAVRRILCECEKQKAACKAVEQQKAQQERYWTGVRIFIQVIGIAASIFMAVNIAAGLFGTNGLLREKEPWASGVVPDTRLKARDCVSALWQVRRATDQFYAAHKAFPQDVVQLFDEGFLSRRLACPLSGKPYVAMTVQGKQVFSCPNPLDHGVTGLWIDVRSGPPEVE